MNRTHAALAATLLLAPLGSPASAQTAPATPARTDSSVVRTFYLSNVTQISDAIQLTDALRNLLPADTKVYYLSFQQALTVRGTPEELALTQKILNDLDRPRKSYRLTYTITDTDGTKRIGTQHFAVVVLVGGRTTLKQGSKVPVATGSYSPGNSSAQTQFTYLDVGLNVDASLDESVDGVRLRNKLEQSSIAQEISGVGTQDPIVRQTVLESTAMLTPGKPLILGTLDIPSSTRRLDVEVVMEPVR